jgi:hypothetical protein
MPLPAIPNHVAGFQGINQTAWGTAETLTPATDGLYPYLGDGLPPAPFPFGYLFEGGRGRAVNSLLKLPMVVPAGRAAETQFQGFFKGAGTAYASAAVLPPNEVHRFLQWAGFDATFSTNKWLYTLTAAGLGYKFGTYGYYAQGKSHLLRDVLADWSYVIDGVGIPIHTFNLRGVVSANRATLALPSITYPRETVDPPVAKAGTYLLGSYILPIVQKGGFTLGRQFGNPRARVTEVDGHMGWVPTGFDPEMTFSIEQTALESTPFHASTGLDPDKLKEAMTGITVSQQVGTVSNNRWSVSMTNAQCSKAEPANDDAIAMWDLAFKPSSLSTITVTLD